MPRAVAHIVLAALVIVASAGGLAGGPAGAGEMNGAALFRRCAACHLPDGAGVPGAYPPLAGRLGKLAGTRQGRSYLIMVVERGLMGSIKAAGQMYSNVMPAQGPALDSAQVAAVLNYVLGTLNAASVPENWPRITAKDVDQVRARHAKPEPGLLLTMRQAAFAGAGGPK